MTCRRMIAMCLVLALPGCSLEEALRQNEERYMRPGALDSPAPSGSSGYATYSYKLMRRYRVTHDWVLTTACDYRAREYPEGLKPHPSDFWNVPEIYEENGSTWQASNHGARPRNIDTLVTSVKVISQAKGDEGRLVELGNQTACFESWLKSSHILVVRLRRGPLEVLQAEVTRQTLASGVTPRWERRTRNGLEWLVLNIPEDQLIALQPNRFGGPYLTWIAALGESGYSMAFTLGANRESLQYPRAHAAMQVTLMHLVDSLKVESLPP